VAEPVVRIFIMRQMVFSKTIAALRDGVVLESWPESKEAVKVRLFKTVTRRSSAIQKPDHMTRQQWAKVKIKWRAGWPHAKSGDVYNAVEWSARIPLRWACGCGWLGSTRVTGFKGPHHLAGGCPLETGHAFLGPVHYRAAKSLGKIHVLDVRQELLGDITAADVAREGFWGKSVEWFVAMYCGGERKADPDRPVTRIEFRLERPPPNG
jgi:hypothetical protein